MGKKDWNAEVGLAVAKIGPAKGADLKVKDRKATQDLLSKLPKADRLYIEQMMYATYCSALRDDRSITESEKAMRVNAYNAEVRKTFINQPQIKKTKSEPDKNVKSTDKSTPGSQGIFRVVFWTFSSVNFPIT
jgi:hypothetical protein